MENIGGAFVVVWLIHPRKRTTLCSLRLAPPSKRWSRLVAKDWHVEEHFANAKDIGLDHYEVRSFRGWSRHITLVLLALAYLAGICARARGSISPPATSEFPPRPAALPLTLRCQCAICSHGSAGPLLRLHAGCWLGHGGVVATKARRAMITSKVVVISWLVQAAISTTL